MPFIAELSDDEKRAYLESLAEPSKEKLVFYRWQKAEVTKELLEAGKMTEYFQKNLYHGNTDSMNNSGAGLYVAEDMIGTSNYGSTIIQVEVKQGYKFLDLSSKIVRWKLKAKGISFEDVRTLNLQVAVRDVNKEFKDFRKNSRWWALKAEKGVKITPVSAREVPLQVLIKSYDHLKTNYKEEYNRQFKDSVKEGIITQLEEGNNLVLRSSLVEIVEEARGRSYVEQALKRYIDSIDTIDEVAYIFRHSKQYLSELDKQRIVDIAKKIPPKHWQDTIHLLHYARGFLSETDREILMKQAFGVINSEKQLKAFQNFLPESEYQAALRKFQTSSKGAVSSRTERLKCLRLQLAIP